MMTPQEGRGGDEGLKIAPGALQMTDETGCHDNGANEVMIEDVRQADGYKSHAERNKRHSL